MSLKDKIKGIRSRTEKPSGPVWKGPEVDGITFSLLSRFLTCRERFRVRAIEGWKPADHFNHRLEYGNMWHVCEEALAGGVSWVGSLVEYAKSLYEKYPLDREQIDKWYNVCRVQFPEYVDYWSKHPDTVNRTPLFQEQVFDVPYKLPSGRTVRMRGKWDSVDFVRKGKKQSVWLQENKTKGDIDPVALQRQLTFDLQTMMYVVALNEFQASGGMAGSRGETTGIAGVRYNVVRRPLSGGKGTIVQKRPSKSNPRGETAEEYYDRLAQYIKDEPETYFMRWNVTVTPADVQRFRERCLDPILMQLCDWYDVVTKGTATWASACHQGYHWQHPFGCDNTIDEYGHGDVDEYLATGSTVGLRRVDDLFPELR